MAVAIFDENTELDGSQFEPFDDSRSSRKRIAALTTISASLTGAIDTRGIDQFRQGVEISSEAYRFGSVGPKIWAGNIKGYTSVKTIGQAVSFTEYRNDKSFSDIMIKFDPVVYIRLGAVNYPYPIVFNDGPQANKEASLQPFTIRFLGFNNVNEVLDTAYSPKASLEEGNQDNKRLVGSTNIISQFIPFNTPNISGSSYSPFLDEGGITFGKTVSGSIAIDGYVDNTDVNILPFNDILNNKLIEQYPSLSSDLRNVLLLKSASLDLDEDIRENYLQKSAPAGFDVYGPGAAQCGCDSIVFQGIARGNWLNGKK